MGIISFDTTELDELIVKLKELDSSKFVDQYKYEIEKSSFLASLKNIARAIVISEIYNVYEPRRYIRTYNLLNSFLTDFYTPDSDNVSEVATYVDTLISGSLDEGYSYATFFEHPESGTFGKGTFISPKGEPEYPRNYRPYVSLLESELNKRSITHGKYAFEKAIKEILGL